LIAYVVLGLLVGVLVGVTGVGGGSLMTPLLVLLFGIHPTTAVGTDLLFAAVTKTVGTGVNSGAGTIDWPVVRRMAAGSVTTTALTLLALAHFGGADRHVVHAITFLLGLSLLLTSLTVLFRPRIVGWSTAHIGRPTPATATWLTVAMGAVLGVLVSMTSVGAGAIGVTALILIYREMPIARVVATDVAHAVPLTLIAGLGHWWLGDVWLPLLGALLLGSIPGIIAGSLLTTRAPERVLRPLLAVVLVAVGIKLLI
jgi:uncharacterized membrane protein YfcA